MLWDALVFFRRRALLAATLLAALTFPAASLAQPYTIDAVAGGGMPPTPMAATTASLAPASALSDSAGNVYFSAGDGVFKMAAGGALTRIAGAPGGGPLGDGGPATSAQLNHPAGLALDSAGNLYIADSYNYRVRKVTPAGIISTVAGTGVRGDSGDGGQAIAATFGQPQAVAVDSAGNVYIADLANSRIRRVNSAGNISTLAGNGTQGYSGDGGPAASAQLYWPFGLAVDAGGNVYIADRSNNVIRKVTPGGTIFTFAGTGSAGHSGDSGPAASAQLSYPNAVALDSAGTVFVGEGSGYVRKIAPGGTITTVAGNGYVTYSGDGGPATAAGFTPAGLAADSSGNLYIADQSNARLRKISPAGTITTVAGNGTLYAGEGGQAAAAQFGQLSGVAVDLAGNLYIADRDDSRILKVTRDGLISTVAGNGNPGSSGDGGPATSAQLYLPTAVAVDLGGGNIYIGDGSAVRKVDSAGIIRTIAGTGVPGYSGDNGPAASAQISFAQSLALDPLGNLYIADLNNARIRKVSPAGMISTVAGNGTAGYSGDGGPATAAQIHWPDGMAVDSAGNLYFSDRYNFRVRRVTPAGIISTVAGSGVHGNSADGVPAANASIGQPSGVAIDHAGNLFIADQDNVRIRRMNPAGLLTTVAGSGAVGHSGDGGPATSAQFELPTSLASASDGRIFVADRNGRVRVLVPSAPSPCSYAVSTEDLLVSGSGGEVRIAIHTDPGCAWGLTNLPSWLTPSDAPNGTGSAEITLTAAAASSARTGLFTIGGVLVPVYQCGAGTACARRVLPHVAFGEVWTTGLFAINTGTSAASFAIEFYSDSGERLSLPLLGATNLLSDSVPALGMKYYEIGNPGHRDVGGWGLVTGDPSIIVQSFFRNQSSEGRFNEGGGASSGGYSRFLVPFDATTFVPAQQPFYTGFAIANVNLNAAAHVTCVARDQSGAVIPNAITVPALPPLGHWADYTFPALTGKRGTLDCSADTLVSALALRIIGTSAFSSLPVLVR
jgi:sugar lactone lactonase YvrE